MKNKLQFCLLLLLGCLLSGSLQAAVFHVTSSGSGSMDGSSWANAVVGNDLQATIDAAAPGDEIWVSCGTYFPTTGTDRSATFAMRNGISIYGSFQGTETSLSQRELTCGPCSILSGEIGQVGIADNSYKVVYNQMLDSTALMDGFDIRNGNDDRSATHSGNGLGGGMYQHGFGPNGFCLPTVRNCYFTNNRASWGAGAFNNGYGQGNAQPTYTNCIFFENHAYIEAGGMDSYGVGGLASPILVNCIFYGNSSDSNVGAMYAWGGNNGNSHPVLINCLFANNRATNGHGGAFIADANDPTASGAPGSCTVTLQNCIVWNNSASNGVGPQFYIQGAGASVIATYSNIDTLGQTGAHPISGSGTGNISLVPQFQDTSNLVGPDGCWMGLDDGLQLVNNSPGVDQGINQNLFAMDLAGNMRVVNTTVDMGPYEFAPATTLSEEVEGLGLQAFPNPVRDWLLVKGAGPADLILFNQLGQKVGVVFQETAPGKTKVQMSALPAGCYWLSGKGDFQLILKK